MLIVGVTCGIRRGIGVERECCPAGVSHRIVREFDVQMFDNIRTTEISCGSVVNIYPDNTTGAD